MTLPFVSLKALTKPWHLPPPSLETLKQARLGGAGDHFQLPAPTPQALHDALMQLPDFGLGASRNPVTQVLSNHLLSPTQAKSVMACSPSNTYGKLSGALKTLFPDASETDLLVSTRRLGTWLNAVHVNYKSGEGGTPTAFTGVMAGRRIRFNYLGGGSNGHVWSMADAQTPEKPLATFKQSIETANNTHYFFPREAAEGLYLTHAQGPLKDAQGVYLAAMNRHGDPAGYQILGEYIAPDANPADRFGKTLATIRLRRKTVPINFQDDFYWHSDQWKLNTNRLGQPLVTMTAPDGQQVPAGPIRIDVGYIDEHLFPYKDTSRKLRRLRRQVRHQVGNSPFSGLPEGYNRWGDLNLLYPRRDRSNLTARDLEIRNRREKQNIWVKHLYDEVMQAKTPTYNRRFWEEIRLSEKAYKLNAMTRGEHLRRRHDIQQRLAHLRSINQRERAEAKSRVLTNFTQTHFFDLGIEDLTLTPPPTPQPKQANP